MNLKLAATKMAARRHAVAALTLCGIVYLTGCGPSQDDWMGRFAESFARAREVSSLARKLSARRRNLPRTIALGTRKWPKRRSVPRSTLFANSQDR